MRMYFYAGCFIAAILLGVYGYSRIEELALAQYSVERGKYELIAIGKGMLNELWPLLLPVAAIASIAVFVTGIFFHQSLEQSDHAGEMRMLKERTKEAQEAAESANKRAAEAEQKAAERLAQEFRKAEDLKAHAAEELKRAEIIKRDALNEANNAKQQREKMKETAINAIKVTKAEKEMEEYRKNNASGASERHRLKMEKLRSDPEALLRFIRQYHPDLVS